MTEPKFELEVDRVVAELTVNCLLPPLLLLLPLVPYVELGLPAAAGEGGPDADAVEAVLGRCCDMYPPEETELSVAAGEVEVTLDERGVTLPPPTVLDADAAAAAAAAFAISFF